MADRDLEREGLLSSVEGLLFAYARLARDADDHEPAVYALGWYVQVAGKRHEMHDVIHGDADYGGPLAASPVPQETGPDLRAAAERALHVVSTNAGQLRLSARDLRVPDRHAQQRWGDELAVVAKDLRAALGGVVPERESGLGTEGESGLRSALIGPHEDDPRWTWLGGVVEALRRHAANDEDPGAVLEGASVLEAMLTDLRPLLSPSSSGDTDSAEADIADVRMSMLDDRRSDDDLERARENVRKRQHEIWAQDPTRPRDTDSGESTDV